MLTTPETTAKWVDSFVCASERFTTWLATRKPLFFFSCGHTSKCRLFVKAETTAPQANVDAMAQAKRRLFVFPGRSSAENQRAWTGARPPPPVLYIPEQRSTDSMRQSWMFASSRKSSPGLAQTAHEGRTLQLSNTALLSDPGSSAVYLSSTDSPFEKYTILLAEACNRGDRTSRTARNERHL